MAKKEEESRKVTIQETDGKYVIYFVSKRGKGISAKAIDFKYDTYEYAEFACQQRDWEVTEI